MPDRTAIFIDGAYLDHIVFESLLKVRIDYSALVSYLASGLDLFRTYYYHCLPYQSNSPTDDEKRRYAGARNFHSTLESLPRFTVRLGNLEYRGNRQDGSPIFQQKRVDILLGVDLTLLSAKGQIQRAILVAGDSDFIPAVDVAKNEGVSVILYHGNSCHQDLWQSADERYFIDDTILDSVKRDSTL